MPYPRVGGQQATVSPASDGVENLQSWPFLAIF